jgi:RNA polymerase sigma-70 factor (ECF subfamily)
MDMGMDEAQIADAYRCHAPAILAHCRRLLASASLAGDATQEVFLKLLAHERRLAPGEETLRYLYRVATNHCLNLLRDRRVRDRAAVDLKIYAGDRGAEPAYADRQLVERLLEQSPVADVEIAVLHWIDGMTQVEIAALLGRSRRAVYSRLKKIEALAVAMGHPAPTARALPPAAPDSREGAA